MVGKFQHRVRKQKAKARLAATQPVPPPSDSNASEIIPSEQDARRAALRAELRAQQAPTISGKKAKRLDHYIDTKLKKEENLELIKKLAAQKVDTSLLRSAKNLGRGSDTRRETLARALEESSRGINADKNAGILLEPRARNPQLETPELAMGDTNETLIEPAEIKPAITFGSGLKRPLHLNADGRPDIKKRKRVKVAQPIVLENELSVDEEDESEQEWKGFSGSDNDNGEDTGNSSEDEQDDSDENGDSTSESEDDDSSTSSAPEGGPSRSSIFKEWAEQQRNIALDFVPSRPAEEIAVPSHVPNSRPAKPDTPVVNAPAVGPLQPPGPTKRAVSIVVTRPEDIQEARMKLPVVQEEQRIIETIHANKITIVCGATGSGKTTQVPQMMYESGYGSAIGSSSRDGTTLSDLRSHGMIGVTQPRRVAATSVATRVAVELGDMKQRVGHQVRFDSKVGPGTAIKFMTDGILLREIAHDFSLSKYSSVVIDEAHERSVNTDILIGILSRIVDLRDELANEHPEKHYPLKLVIMSATMRVEDFTRNDRLFRHGAPPVVQAEGRQYPVVNHFARQTRIDYVQEMFRKIKRGHRKLPRGGMLIFLTGQAEIITLMELIKGEFSSTDASHVPKKALQDVDSEDDNHVVKSRVRDQGQDEDDIHGLGDEEEAEFDVEPEDEADRLDGTQKVHVHPLYSALTAAQQAKVFEPPPEGSRLIVLATNVAETSITIPGVRYVFDCGRAKEKHYDTATGVQKFEVGWISKASAAQRAGRAGRTGPGHCYRLYSSAVFERDFEEYSVPEILRTPLENIALLIKDLDFPNVANFPFPTAPDRHALSRAEKLLGHLGAIDAVGKITDLGRRLMHYPLNPRFAKMILLAANAGLLPYTIALVSALATPELLLSREQVVPSSKLVVTSDSSDSESTRKGPSTTESNDRLKAYTAAQSTLSRFDPRCDAIKLLTAFAVCSRTTSLPSRCAELFIREKSMTEALDLRAQLIRVVQAHHPTGADDLLALPPLTDQDKLAKLKYILAAGFSDHIAVRADLLGLVSVRPVKRGVHVAYRTLLASSQEGGEDVFIHPGSVLAGPTPKAMPAYIVYSHLSRGAARTVGTEEVGRVRMHPLTSVGRAQVLALLEGTGMLEVGKPIGKVKEVVGQDGRKRRECWVGVAVKPEGDGARWDMGERKEVQVRAGGEWVTEKVIG